MGIEEPTAGTSTPFRPSRSLNAPGQRSGSAASRSRPGPSSLRRGKQPGAQAADGTKAEGRLARSLPRRAVTPAFAVAGFV